MELDVAKLRSELQDLSQQRQQVTRVSCDVWMHAGLATLGCRSDYHARLCGAGE
jgi:hypothetical protein